MTDNEIIEIATKTLIPHYHQGKFRGVQVFEGNSRHLLNFARELFKDEREDKSPEPSMTNCVAEGEPPNGCSAWNVWFNKLGSHGILHNLKISSLNDNPEPIITRVEVITHEEGRVYVNWKTDNKITTSLQDDGRTLKVFVTQNTEELEMHITKPEFYDNLPPGDKTLYRVAEKEVSKQWATALSNFIDEFGGGSPSLWEWSGITPTPEKIVECLRELVEFHMTIAADNELDECCEWLEAQLCMPENAREDVTTKLRAARRSQPTLKSQALKDFKTVRKHSDLLPEILDTIEKALKSIPE